MSDLPDCTTVTQHEPQLSALSTDLDDLIRRVSTIAYDLDHESTQRASAILFETERSLRGAARRLEAARKDLAEVHDY